MSRSAVAPASVRLPRPTVSVAADPAPGRRLRIALVCAVAGVHATITGGALLVPVLVALDRLLPRGALPAVRAKVAPGVEIELDRAGAMARGAVIADGYEHRECEMLVSALRPDGIFLDVGANVGWFSLLAAVHRPEARVWAVEPVPETADRLEANLRAAGVSDRVRVVRCAAGPAAGSASFRTPTDLALASRVTDPAIGDPVVRCPVVALDELWRAADCPRVDAIKLDVEGDEVAALRGARELLSQDHPLVVAEAASPAARAALTCELSRHGYRSRQEPGLLAYNTVFTADRS
ncbi:MAG: FkbM family methyltransferase [Actinophytocola sp.]|uniref:FkbM family methyltransferase n=1 Tax=Actinophytocola sp. TaxID=1872138 RepID=UPI003C77AC05